MKSQFLQGKPVGDDFSKVCILFDPKDGRVVHVHGSTTLHSKNAIAPAEMEARARRHALHFGKPVAALKVLHVRLTDIRENGDLRVNKTGDGLIPSPRVSARKRRP